MDVSGKIRRKGLFVFIILSGILLTAGPLTAYCQLNQKAAEALLHRVVPRHASQFIIEAEPAGEQPEGFTIAGKEGRILIKAGSGTAVASGLYYYLNHYCHAQITWNGVQMHLPEKLPVPDHIIRKQTPYTYRYYLNYCTFNYSMSWWDWTRWEKEIDWMALHGINMPLAITGEAYTWYLVYKEMGFTDGELQGFFSGPAYFSWFWMGNLDGWGGPLPLSWMKSHFELQKKILERERSLGMTPVLPAFTGHVPKAFKEKFPEAKLKTTSWGNGFADTYILDAHDPLFEKVAQLFLKKQTALLGTDHLYSADTFNENEPPSDAPDYLADLSKKIYQGMQAVDSAAVWVMQGWLFFSDRKFWKAPQIKALLDAVPDDKMIVLDLATEIEPVWKRTEAFYGKPWIWNMLNNFGGNNNLFGRMETVATGPAMALASPLKGRLSGIGLTMEAIEQNPVIYELMMENTWRNTPIDLNSWLPAYLTNRYEVDNIHARKAWEILQKTVYTVPASRYKRDGNESILQARPTFDSSTRWTNTSLNYDGNDLVGAWSELMLAAPACHNSDGFQYDLVDLGRQVLANYALVIQQKAAAAYKAKNLNVFHKEATSFIELIEDLDALLATRQDFLLGPWIADARKWGTTTREKALYEFNAKDLITLWGDKECKLHEYSCRQWSGLLDDFYKPRWQQFFDQAELALRQGKSMDQAAFEKKIKDWEWHWVNQRKDYPTKPKGDPVALSRKLYTKYITSVTGAF
ncbi:alpha-N-acetylglucosaminidase [Arachidicoccus rhizosphaerae]|uniref:Alpha-N-acetylglucosaminidase n=1 Tax=Arachidicoccus rhizosphaerae TaxID=551991 RepID=A0A1H3VH50_9BACT|nr:alpha-N-acetylglucosaminidase [Arachidicoccus rhizosphaerae]SDZ74125.1 alpha-N-acetylglucosaminidase [Arachidicoccus rhizosphaerae]